MPRARKEFFDAFEIVDAHYGTPATEKRRVADLDKYIAIQKLWSMT
jgi:hypothetical protein